MHGLCGGSFTPDSFIKLSYKAGELDNTLTSLLRTYHSTDDNCMQDSTLSHVTTESLSQARDFLIYISEKVIDISSLITLLVL